MNKNLDRLELYLRAIFEEKLISIFINKEHQAGLIDELIKAMRDNLKSTDEGKTYAPDHFSVHVHNEDHPEWKIHQDILNNMIASLYKKGQSDGLNFLSPPTIELLIDDQTPKNNFFVSAGFTKPAPNLPDTAPMVIDETFPEERSIPNGAYFIVGGETHIPLIKPVVNIGRHSESDLVIEDLHVSRHHAQLRAISQHYVIFDTGSTGGLFLNNKRISQATLHSGDVIRMGSVNLIYIQEATSTNPTTAISIDESNRMVSTSQDNFDISGDGEL